MRLLREGYVRALARLSTGPTESPPIGLCARITKVRPISNELGTLPYWASLPYCPCSDRGTRRDENGSTTGNAISRAGMFFPFSVFDTRSTYNPADHYAFLHTMLSPDTLAYHTVFNHDPTRSPYTIPLLAPGLFRAHSRMARQ